MEDSAAVSNPPPVPRPASMGPIPSSPHTTIPQNKPGKVSDLEAQGNLAKEFQRGPPIIQKQDKPETPSAWRDRKGTEEKRMKMEESALLTLVSSVDRPSSAVEVFIPELFKKCVEDETKDEYRFLCPHAGQFMCKVTQLIFEMEGEGEVLYRIVSWDSCPLDGLGQKEPAGPLYSINCHEGSIRKLHLPHCETRTDEVKLSVAHVTGGNVEIIQPLQVTDTHVIIAVHNLSRFGLLMIFGDYPIKAQVLVFDMNLKGKHRKNKLHMHLLPGNVPAEEVKKQECNMSMSASCQPNIASRATCDLTPGKEYRPVSKNTHHEITIQPEFKKFERDYGPNYHPTFEVFFNSKVDEVTLGLLDENKKEVWSRLVLLTGTEAASTTINTTGIKFVDTYRAELILRVSSVMEIADCLKAMAMMTDELYSNIQAATTRQEKMRELYNCLNSGDVKAEFYRILQEKETYLVQELQSGMSYLRNT